MDWSGWNLKGLVVGDFPQLLERCAIAESLIKDIRAQARGHLEKRRIYSWLGIKAGAHEKHHHQHRGSLQSGGNTGD